MDILAFHLNRTKIELKSYVHQTYKILLPMGLKKMNNLW